MDPVHFGDVFCATDPSQRSSEEIAVGNEVVQWLVAHPETSFLFFGRYPTDVILTIGTLPKKGFSGVSFCTQYRIRFGSYHGTLL